MGFAIYCSLTNRQECISTSYLSTILAAFVILSCPSGNFPDGLTYLETSPKQAKVWFGNNEYIGGLPIGSVLYIFDRETDKFLALRFRIEFSKSQSKTFVEEKQIQPGACFWNVIGAYKDASRYLKTIREFFTEQFVMPPALDYTDKNSVVSAWYSVGEGYDVEVALKNNGILFLEVGITKKH